MKQAKWYRRKLSETLSAEEQQKNYGIIHGIIEIKPNIKLSILPGTKFTNSEEGYYELAFFRNDLPMEIPQKIKEIYKDNIFMHYFLANMSEYDIDYILSNVRYI